MASAEEPFPHRRALQRSMHALRNERYPGIMVHGGDELRRATFAGRVLRRMERERSRVIVSDDFSSSEILKTIVLQTGSEGVSAIADRYTQTLRANSSRLQQALREIIEGPCQDAGDGAIVLVLHGFDPESIGTADPNGRRQLSPERLVVAQALISAFVGARSASRLLFTCTAPFSVPKANGDKDLVKLYLLTESLEPPVLAQTSGAATMGVS
jgi:hypothetical protein